MYMTREEARQALIDGKRVKHYNFTASEYLYMDGNRIMTEDGYFFTDRFDENEWMEDGWVIVEAPVLTCLMDVIREFPNEFINTCHGRAGTTPSIENRKNHLNLAYCIENERWDHAAVIVSHPEYRRPLNGVVICLMTYGNSIPRDVYHQAIEFEREGKLI